MSGPRPAGKRDAKMRIKAFPVSMDEEFVNTIWRMLRRAIHEIQRKNNSGLSFEELYRNAYTMVLHKHGDRLYSGLSEVVSEHLEAVIKRDVLNSLNRDFLHALNNAWTEHHTAMVMIRDILMYMDRVYVSNVNKLLPVYDLGLILFRDVILSDQQIGPHLRNVLLDMVSRERHGEVVDRAALKNACSMLMRLGVDDDRSGVRDVLLNSAVIQQNPQLQNDRRRETREVYERFFENQFLNQSAEFYREEAERLLAENSASVYIRKVESRIHEEAERARHFLDPSTEQKIVHVLEETLVRQNMNTLVEMENSGLVHMLENNRFEDLHCMYRLFVRVEGGVECMLQYLSAYLIQQGTLLVSEGNSVNSADFNVINAKVNSASTKDPVQFVQSILELKDRFDRFVTESFDGLKRFRQRVSVDFERFINQNPRSPEYLSLFIDEKLKRGAKGLSDQELEAVLDKAIVLFRFLAEKDVFERYYKQHLAKRLLFLRSGSDDSEKLMISKLKVECGCQFTQKLEGMFKDIGVSLTLSDDFRAFISGKVGSSEQLSRTGNVELSVRVLTAVYWPITCAAGPGVLPNNIAIAYDLFTSFYNTKHTNRKLALQPQLGTADILATFYGPSKFPSNELASSKGLATDILDEEGSEGIVTSTTAIEPGKPRKHILIVSTHQMMVLMLFNKRERFAFNELQTETEIPEKDLIRALQALALGKAQQRILIKDPHSKDIESQHVFSVYDSFASRCLRVRVQAVSSSRSGADAEPERAETRLRIDEDRNIEIEAAIVRILKARKTMRHNQLLAEVAEQLKSRFTPSPAVIKRRVENLIDKEYLSRDKNDKSLYTYQA